MESKFGDQIEKSYQVPGLMIQGSNCEKLPSSKTKCCLIPKYVFNLINITKKLQV